MRSSKGVEDAVSKVKFSKGSSGEEDEGLRLNVPNKGEGIGM
jgi:hypothetical protein